MRTLLFVGALALVANAHAVHAAAAPQQIPIAKLAALPSVHNPVLSPDGDRIAARSDNKGNVAILIIDADHPEVPAAAIPFGKVSISGVKWAGNRRLLVQILQTTSLAGGEFPYLRLLAVDIDSGAARVLDPNSRGFYAGNVLYADPTGSWALVASQDNVFSYPSVKRFDLTTGKSQVI